MASTFPVGISNQQHRGPDVAPIVPPPGLPYNHGQMDHNAQMQPNNVTRVHGRLEIFGASSPI